MGPNASGQGAEIPPRPSAERIEIERLLSSDPYVVFDLPRSATEADFKVVKINLLKKFHPDTNKMPGAKEIYQNISASFDTLKKQGFAQAQPQTAAPRPAAPQEARPKPSRFSKDEGPFAWADVFEPGYEFGSGLGSDEGPKPESPIRSPKAETSPQPSGRLLKETHPQVFRELIASIRHFIDQPSQISNKIHLLRITNKDVRSEDMREVVNSPEAHALIEERLKDILLKEPDSKKETRGREFVGSWKKAGWKPGPNVERLIVASMFNEFL